MTSACPQKKVIRPVLKKNTMLLLLKMHLIGTTSAKTNLSELESQKHCICLKIILSSCTHAQKHENDISVEFEKWHKR